MTKRTDTHSARFHEAYEIVMQDRLLNHQPSITLGDKIARLQRRWRYQFLPHYFARPPQWRVTLRKRLGGPRVLPNFACIGPIKSGSSDLANYLFAHPAVMVPLAKEIRSTDHRDWLPHYPTREEFDAVAREQGAALTGFFYPWLHKLLLVDELAKVSPTAKIILLLRDPVERAYSHYKWDLFLGGPGIMAWKYFRTFHDYLRHAIGVFPSMEMPAPCGQQLLSTGIYEPSVRRWLEAFGRENVLVVTSEAFFEDPVSLVGECFDFLGVPRVPVEPFKVVNPNPLKTPPFDAESRRMLSEFYRPYNERLYELLGRDLGWK